MDGNIHKTRQTETQSLPRRIPRAQRFHRQGFP
jgi:hypothetical protein